MKILPFKFKNKNSDKLIVIFQSFNQQLYEKGNVDHFELENSFDGYNLNCDLLFIKDIQRGFWYLSNVEQILQDFQNIISKYNKVMSTGISAGGFGAILYGSLLHFDLVVAINPQTSLFDLENGESLVQPAYPLYKLYNDDPSIKRYMDLKNHINNTTHYYLNGWYNPVDKTPTIHHTNDKLIDYCTMNHAQKLHDIKNYQHLEDFPNVFWLNFMIRGYKGNDFIDLIRKYGFE